MRNPFGETRTALEMRRRSYLQMIMVTLQEMYDKWVLRSCPVYLLRTINYAHNIPTLRHLRSINFVLYFRRKCPMTKSHRSWILTFSQDFGASQQSRSGFHLARTGTTPRSSKHRPDLIPSGIWRFQASLGAGWTGIFPLSHFFRFVSPQSVFHSQFAKKSKVSQSKKGENWLSLRSTVGKDEGKEIRDVVKWLQPRQSCQ